MASDKPSIRARLFAALKRSWRTIAARMIRWATILFVAVLAVSQLMGAGLGAATRFTGLFVIALSCVSLAYWLIVSHRIHVRLPGLDRQDAEELEDAATDEAGDTERQERVVTVQVDRLDVTAAHVTIANDAPLPVLHAETTLTLGREGEGADRATVATSRVKGKSFSLPAHSVVPTPLAHVFNHVGIYRLRSMGVRVYDLLGVFSHVSEAPGQWRVRVVPNIYRLTYGIPRERKVLQSSLGLPDTPADALDYDRVRDWRPGDPLKTIHWKLVAHSRGELYTKLFETSTVSDIMLLLDPYGPDDTAGRAATAHHLYDTMLEGGLSLLEHARENGIPGRMRLLDRSGNLVSAPWEGPGMRGWLVESSHRPASNIDARNASLRAIRSLRQQHPGYVIMATSRLSEASVEELIACHHAGIPLLVVHAISKDSTEEAKQQRAFDERLRDASVAVVALTDGRLIVREVIPS